MCVCVCSTCVWVTCACAMWSNLSSTVGTCIGVVIKTGDRTVMGRIAQLTGSIQEESTSHTHTHTHTHTHMHTHTHTRTHAHTHTHTHTHACAHTHAYTHTVHTYACSTLTYPIQTLVQAFICLHMRTVTHTLAHTDSHTHAHIHVHTHTCTQNAHPIHNVKYIYLSICFTCMSHKRAS